MVGVETLSIRELSILSVLDILQNLSGGFGSTVVSGALLLESLTKRVRISARQVDDFDRRVCSVGRVG